MYTCTHIFGAVIFAWLFSGFYHLGPFYFDGIHKEAFAQRDFNRYMVFVPKMPVSWILIIPVCLLCGPLARKAMKKLFGMEHDYFEEKQEEDE